MREKIAVYRSGLPVNPPLATESDYYGRFDNEFRQFWTNGSYYCIFAGMGHLPDRRLGRLAYRPAAIAAARATLADIRADQQRLCRELPTNHAYLRHLHGVRYEDSAPPAPGVPSAALG